MAQYITINGRRYTIRGGATAKRIRLAYESFIRDTPTTSLSLFGYVQLLGLIHSETAGSIKRRRNKGATL
jgi:hypothetical protein